MIWVLRFLVLIPFFWLCFLFVCVLRSSSPLTLAALKIRASRMSLDSKEATFSSFLTFPVINKGKEVITLLNLLQKSAAKNSYCNCCSLCKCT
ncbi:uncharacterized protein EV154DRAFT_505826 [Mucor mucedo]|uniref:uncharacterized protein n=1 Tax=Mucor mucedo TaxID=29922 RepID=UPI0022204465|nr:uncharacterized protein EV154DRAFT_505826 [Mucor mucedo]KAI7892164.1 hypothetical protein EV154DRAFT_505826 [Mucor mucedo]